MATATKTAKEKKAEELKTLYASKSIPVFRRLPVPGQEHLRVKHLSILVGTVTSDLTLSGPDADFVVSQWMEQGGYTSLQTHHIGLDQPSGMWLMYIMVK